MSERKAKEMIAYGLPYLVGRSNLDLTKIKYFTDSKKVESLILPSTSLRT